MCNQIVPGHRMRSILAGLLTALALTGCSILTATRPSVEVDSVELRAVGLLDQVLAVSLCVTNPNDTTLSFQRIHVAFDVNGAPLVDGQTASAVTLPPHASVPVPFVVATTLANLGPQLLGVLRNGAVDYRVRGSVQLAGPLALTLPFSRSGRLDLLSGGPQVLADAVAATGTRCAAMTPL